MTWGALADSWLAVAASFGVAHQSAVCACSLRVRADPSLFTKLPGARYNHKLPGGPGSDWSPVDLQPLCARSLAAKNWPRGFKCAGKVSPQFLAWQTSQS